MVFETFDDVDFSCFCLPATSLKRGQMGGQTVVFVLNKIPGWPNLCGRKMVKANIRLTVL